MTINISTEFTDAPGARFKTDGPKSGEEFYEELLRPRFDAAKSAGEKLVINLDNTWGYASSFISGSFGRLSEDCGVDAVLSVLDFISKDDPLYIDKIKNEIRNPNSQ